MPRDNFFVEVEEQPLVRWFAVLPGEPEFNESSRQLFAHIHGTEYSVVVRGRVAELEYSTTGKPAGDAAGKVDSPFTITFSGLSGKRLLSWLRWL